MILFHSCTFLLTLIIRLSVVFAQTSTYTGYRTNVPFSMSCSNVQYFDTASMQCLPCPSNAKQMSGDPTQCDCISTAYRYSVNQGGGSLICELCQTNFMRSSDGFGCFNTSSSCGVSTLQQVELESDIDGSLFPSTLPSSSQPRVGTKECKSCSSGTWARQGSQRCVPCASVTPRYNATYTDIECCNASTIQDGMCLTYVQISSLSSINNNSVFSISMASLFIQQHLSAAFYLCRMNLNKAIAGSSTRSLLSNATACQVLANIAAMQFYYNGPGYAYQIYDTEIWDSTGGKGIWPNAETLRPSIPFLAYPTDFYKDITSDAYNWIPANYKQNDLLKLKLAKYSWSGQFLGLVDAFDGFLQFCGGGYTDGRAAFTFGAQYSRACNIRVDALWNSILYETAFYDPYIAFTQNGTDYLLPVPVVIKNYKLATDGTYPNQLQDESKWTFHRRFFLVDRLSGVTASNESKYIHYAKSIRIVNELTLGETYILPPIILIEYDEISSSQLGQGSVVQVAFESTYQMDLRTHILNIWIAFAVLAGLGVILAFFRTAAWHSRGGKNLIDLPTIGKLIIYLCNVWGLVVFIILGGVSLWWLIFYKRQDTITLVMPTSFQQASFTALVSLSFILKTIDIIHLIFRQATADLFFIDWEKPKPAKKNSVSIWRTYFVANEFQEIQTFRRVDPVFQLFFVLFLLKVVNLENVATMEPGVNLFPSSADYKPEYSQIIHVGIAFSMWLGTALVQYLFYIIIYQRFVEDKILNFIDLCSVSNISVFILSDFLYGYYIHGLSPHGTTETNMKDMLLNFERESNRSSATRGLQAKSEEQTFIMRLDRRFRLQYSQLLRIYQSKMKNRDIPSQGNQNKRNEALESYRNMNEFLSGFINHSSHFDYKIRERTFFEKFLNYEFDDTNRGGIYTEEDTVFLVDKEQNFKATLFCGHENSLLIWNTSTFLFFDYFTRNYVLAAILTYLLDLIAAKFRMSLGRKNMSLKTQIPKQFFL